MILNCLLAAEGRNALYNFNQKSNFRMNIILIKIIKAHYSLLQQAGNSTTNHPLLL